MANMLVVKLACWNIYLDHPLRFQKRIIMRVVCVGRVSPV
ncbi:hypothetical protein DSUL_90097 [Desulfovibrionales bacterium]